jgi:hypothetical protein
MTSKSYFVYQENNFEKHQSKLDNSSRLHEQSLFTIFVVRCNYCKKMKENEKRKEEFWIMVIVQI